MFKRALRLAKIMGVKVHTSDFSEIQKDGVQCYGKYDYEEDRIHVCKQLWEEDPMKAVHVLIHELVHATGAEKRLARPSLRWYQDGEIYEKGEEQIAEAGCFALEKFWESDHLGFYSDWVNSALARQQHADLNFEEDILPEVQRMLNYVYSLEVGYEKQKSKKA